MEQFCFDFFTIFPHRLHVYFQTKKAYNRVWWCHSSSSWFLACNTRLCSHEPPEWLVLSHVDCFSQYEFVRVGFMLVIQGWSGGLFWSSDGVPFQFHTLVVQWSIGGSANMRIGHWHCSFRTGTPTISCSIPVFEEWPWATRWWPSVKTAWF